MRIKHILTGFLGVLCGLLFLISAIEPINPAQAQTLQGMDLIVVLDVSGSMDNNITFAKPNDYLSIDPETYAWLNQLSPGSSRPATDPDQLRFEATSFVFDYLSAVGQNHSLTMNATVITFARSARVYLPWTNLNAGNASPASTGTSQPTGVAAPVSPYRLTSPAKEGSGPWASNYSDLYKKIKEQFDNRPDRAKHNPVLMVITDSADCTSQTPGDCKLVPSMANSLISAYKAASLTGLTQYIFYLVPALPTGPPPKLAGTFDTVKDAFRQIIASNGSLQVLEGPQGLNTLPAAMFGVILDQVAQIRGLTVNNSLGMGIASVDNAFTVPPYQSSLTIYAMLEGDTVDISVRASGNSITPQRSRTFGSTNRVRVLQFDKPQPGNWTLGGSLKAWASFRNATTRVRLDPEVPSQYVPFRVIYEVIDSNNRPFVEESYQPDFAISVMADGKTYPLRMNRVTTPGGQAFGSDYFYPLTAEPHAVHIAVKPQPGWTTSNSTYTFLTPPQAQPLSVIIAPISFVPTFGSSDQRSPDGQSVIIPRSATLPIKVRASNDTIPDGIKPVLSFSTPEGGKPCPIGEDLALAVAADRSSATTNLNFALAGDCDVYLTMTVNNVYEPQPNTTKVIFPKTFIGRAKITSTMRLYADILDRNANPVPQTGSGSESHFNMTDLNWQLQRFEDGHIGWPMEKMNIEVVLRDEDSTVVVAPRFASTPAVGGTTGNDVLCGDAEVPLVLSLTRLGGDGADEARRRGIKLCKTARPGYYVATIAGLNPADYELQLRVRPDLKLDTTINEYGALLQPSSVLKARLHVSSNPYVLAQIISSSVAGLLIAVLVGIRTKRRYENTAYALSGDLVIFMRDEVGSCTELWRGVLPKRMTQDFPASALATAALNNNLPISSVLATTKRQKKIAANKSAYVIVRSNAKTLINDTNPLRFGEAINLDKGMDSSGNQVRFYIVKVDHDGGIPAN